MRQLDLFRDTLPLRPWCTDELGHLEILPRLEAIGKRYIEPNHPTMTRWLVFDQDYDGASEAWRYRDAPAPNLVVENGENGHAHSFYGLQWPVHADAQKAVRYAAAIQWELNERLAGDWGYHGPLAKNPLSRHWRVLEYAEYLYELTDLHESLGRLTYQDRRRRLPEFGLGRNCNLFNDLRRWAYRARLQVAWPDQDAWLMAVLREASERNFPDPEKGALSYREVRSVAKSVARWTWERMTPEGFSAVQRARVQKRWGDQVERRRQILLDLRNAGFGESIRKLAKITGIPRTTTHRLLGCPNTISGSRGIPLLTPLFRDSLQTERTTRETAGEA